MQDTTPAFHHNPSAQQSRLGSGDYAAFRDKQNEQFVDAETVAAFLSIRRAEVLKLTRERKIRGYAYKGRLRHVYRYRLSEVSEDFASFAYQPKGTIAAAAPVSQRRNSNG
jgi:hypothetical protein